MPAARREVRAPNKTLRLSHPVRVARKPAKNDFSGFRAGDRAGWRGRPLGPAQAPGLGTWRGPPLHSELPKMFVLAAFRETLAGSPPRTGAGGPGSLDSARTPPGGYPPQPGRFSCQLAGSPSDRRRRPRVPGFCQPGAPDPPGGVPPTPPKAAKKACFGCFWRGRPLDRPRRPRPGAPDPPGGTPPDPPGHTQKTKATPTVVGLGSFFIA